MWLDDNLFYYSLQQYFWSYTYLMELDNLLYFYAYLHKIEGLHHFQKYQQKFHFVVIPEYFFQIQQKTSKHQNPLVQWNWNDIFKSHKRV